MRAYVLRALLRKEALRIRYNPGLLVVIGAVLTLSALVSLGSRLTGMLGDESLLLNQFVIEYSDVPGSGIDARPLIEQLKNGVPDELPNIKFEKVSEARLREPRLPAVGIVIVQVDGGPDSSIPLASSPAPKSRLQLRFWYYDFPPGGLHPYREWLVDEARQFLGTERLQESYRSSLGSSYDDLRRRRREAIPVIYGALAFFALYLISFNLYITSTGEEREKRVMLALLLSPASSAEIIAAKTIFYGGASVVVAAAIVGMYEPILLLDPLLWITLGCGAIGYISLGTVVISLVRRQTTINTVSLAYLMGTAVIFGLGTSIELFGLLGRLQFEYYLTRQIRMLVSGEPFNAAHMKVLGTYIPAAFGRQVALAGIVAAWALLANYIFTTRATQLGKNR